MDVAVIKWGVGNTASVMFALERLGAKAQMTNDPRRVADAERVIVPGVGAAAPAMRALHANGLGDALLAFPRPLLGICLGQQLLYEHSEEGDVAGLGLIPGRVTKLKCAPRSSPHIGWSTVQIERPHPLFAGVTSGEYFYFVHSYACPLGITALAHAEYGDTFAAAIAKDNAFGCQFHPERSGAAGARVLRNFLALPC